MSLSAYLLQLRLHMLHFNLHAQEVGLWSNLQKTSVRLRTGGDFVYVARACRVPLADAQRLDKLLHEQLQALLGLGAGELYATTSRRLFLAGRDGGAGFQSVEMTAPAAHAASLHTCLPKTLQRLNMPSTNALISASPWAAHCLVHATATFRSMVRDSTVDLGDANAHASQHLLAMGPLAAARNSIITDLSSKPAKQRPCAAQVDQEGSHGYSRRLNQRTTSQTRSLRFLFALVLDYLSQAAMASASTAAQIVTSVARHSTYMVLMRVTALLADGLFDGMTRRAISLRTGARSKIV